MRVRDLFEGEVGGGVGEQTRGCPRVVCRFGVVVEVALILAFLAGERCGSALLSSSTIRRFNADRFGSAASALL